MEQKQCTSSIDKCACQCFPNGVIATVAVNVMLWTAVIFSGGAVVDCHMVRADIVGTSAHNGTTWPALPINLVGLTDGKPGDRRGFGYFIHEDDNGDCRWAYWGDEYDEDEEEWTSADGKEFEAYVVDYFDWMGRDWRRSGKVGAGAFGLGFLLAVAAAVYGCVGHVRPIRIIMGVLVLCMASLQFSSLALAMDSDFCDDRDCNVARSGYFAITAGAFYLLAAPGFFWMKNYAPSSSQETSVATATGTHAGVLLPVQDGVVTEEETIYPVDNTHNTARVVAIDDSTNQGDDLERQHTLGTITTIRAAHVTPHDNDNDNDNDGLSAAREIKATQIY